MLSLDVAANFALINLRGNVLPEWKSAALLNIHMESEFSFATAAPFYRLLPSPQTSNQLQTFSRLNEAHPTSNSDSFLGWRRKGGSAGVR